MFYIMGCLVWKALTDSFSLFGLLEKLCGRRRILTTVLIVWWSFLTGLKNNSLLLGACLKVKMP